MTLPKVYQNKNIGNINNDQQYYYSLNSNNTITNNNTNNIDVKDKINKLFKSRNYIYKIKVDIKTTTHEFTKTIIGKNNNSLITIENELIPIDTIVDIKEEP